MRYIVEKTDIINPGIDSAEWNKAQAGKVSEQMWQKYYQKINTTFKLLRGPQGISVLMHTDEKNLRAVNLEENSKVCEDSCMEFFFKPDPWDLNYVNFELNPNGAMFLSVGTDRYNRKLLDTDREIFKIESLPEEGNWLLKFYIPDEFLFKHFNKIADVCRGNFYKCGDFTDHTHFISWSGVEVKEPDFHVPDFFGQLEFKK